MKLPPEILAHIAVFVGGGSQGSAHLAAMRQVNRACREAAWHGVGASLATKQERYGFESRARLAVAAVTRARAPLKATTQAPQLTALLQGQRGLLTASLAGHQAAATTTGAAELTPLRLAATRGDWPTLRTFLSHALANLPGVASPALPGDGAPSPQQSAQALVDDTFLATVDAKRPDQAHKLLERRKTKRGTRPTRPLPSAQARAKGLQVAAGLGYGALAMRLSRSLHASPQHKSGEALAKAAEKALRHEHVDLACRLAHAYGVHLGFKPTGYIRETDTEHRAALQKLHGLYQHLVKVAPTVNLSTEKLENAWHGLARGAADRQL